MERGELVMEAVVCSVDGVQYVRQKASAPPEQAAELGQKMAQMLIEGGARNILNEVNRSRG
jgi:porphobilinogen deaminase